MSEVKKTMEMDQEAIEKLRKIFNVKTDKEAVNRALRLVVSEDEIIETHQKLSGTLELEEMFK